MTLDKSIAFTGSRPKSLVGTYNENLPEVRKVKRALEILVARSYLHGYRTFYSGMALGWDTWGAEAVIEFRKSHADVRLIAAVPFVQQAAQWPFFSQRRWTQNVKAANEVWVVEFDRLIAPQDWDDVHHSRDFAAALQWLDRRNRWMADRASVMLGGWDGSSSGTKNCLSYARDQEHMKSIVIYYPMKDRLTIERRIDNGVWSPAEVTLFEL